MQLIQKYKYGMRSYMVFEKFYYPQATLYFFNISFNMTVFQTVLIA